MNTTDGFDMRYAAWLLTGLLLQAVGCERRGSDAGDSPAEERAAYLVISGDTAGWLIPCGCTANQSGGMLRRGTYVNETRKTADVTYLDAGGAPAGATEYDRVKFEAILAGEMVMGVAAHNLGGREIALGADYLRDLESRTKVPFVCANAHDTAGRRLAQPARVIDTVGRKLLIVGVVSAKYADANVRIDDPRRAVLDVAAEMKGRFDAMVVLAYLPDEELGQLATSLPEADAVIGGPTGQAIAPRMIGPTVFGAATNKGKYLIRLRVPSRKNEHWSGEVVEMSPSLPDQSQQLANVDRYVATLADRDFSANQAGLAPTLPTSLPEDYRVAGSESCLACHREDHAKWLASGHGHAWKTLESKHLHVDPSCQQCHTTGYGLPGGFESMRRSAALVSVGCESCHGPSQAHTKTPTRRTAYNAADQCLRCHDQENSPAFNYTTYWARIRHGKN